MHLLCVVLHRPPAVLFNLSLALLQMTPVHSHGPARILLPCLSTRCYLGNHLYCLPYGFHLVCPLSEFMLLMVSTDLHCLSGGSCFSSFLLCIEGQPGHFLELQMSSNCINVTCAFLIPACLVSDVGYPATQ